MQTADIQAKASDSNRQRSEMISKSQLTARNRVYTYPVRATCTKTQIVVGRAAREPLSSSVYICVRLWFHSPGNRSKPHKFAAVFAVVCTLVQLRAPLSAKMKIHENVQKPHATAQTNRDFADCQRL
jgi:hypothetical protein